MAENVIWNREDRKAKRKATHRYHVQVWYVGWKTRRVTNSRHLAMCTSVLEDGRNTRVIDTNAKEHVPQEDGGSSYRVMGMPGIAYHTQIGLASVGLSITQEDI